MVCIVKILVSLLDILLQKKNINKRVYLVPLLFEVLSKLFSNDWLLGLFDQGVKGAAKLSEIPESISDVVYQAQQTTLAKVVRLLYTNFGFAVLALGSNAVHKLWKWQRTERNPSGKSTASVVPQLWQPSNGVPMTNEMSDGNLEDATSPDFLPICRSLLQRHYRCVWCTNCGSSSFSGIASKWHAGDK